MLTPLDIENKNFKKSFRGYDIKEIDSFLEDIIVDYEKVYRENIELKDKVNLFSAQIRYYNTMEETLKETLITAQTTSEEIISVARAKSINITDEAELNGERIIKLANERVRDIRQEYEYLRKEMFSFKTRYQTFIEAQLLSLEKFHKDMEDNAKESKISDETEDKDVEINIKNDSEKDRINKKAKDTKMEEIDKDINKEELKYLHEEKEAKNIV